MEISDEERSKLVSELMEATIISEFDAECVVDHLVSKEEFIGEIVGCLEEEYCRLVSQIECGNEELMNWVKDQIIDRLCDMSPSFCDIREYTSGLNIISSDIEETHYAIFGSSNPDYFVVFTEDEISGYSCLADEKVFHPASDVLIWSNEIKEEVIKKVRELNS